MTLTSFTAKNLRVTFTLNGTNQKFPGTNSNQLVLEGLRTSVRAESVARQTTLADVRIFGMKSVDMNALTVAWANPPVVLDHLMTVEANSGAGWTTVFKGTLVEAQPEYRQMPNVYFHALARTGSFAQINAAAPTSYTGAAQVAEIAKALADQMGFAFVDGGATGILMQPYLDGTLYDQLVSTCAAGGADFYFLGDTLLVTDAGKPREDAPAVVLNPSSGLIGYPVYDRAGLLVSAIFDPGFLCGSPIDLTSAAPGATGRWYPYGISHTLESLTPNGQWRSDMKCLRVIV